MIRWWKSKYNLAFLCNRASMWWIFLFYSKHSRFFSPVSHARARNYARDECRRCFMIAIIIFSAMSRQKHASTFWIRNEWRVASEVHRTSMQSRAKRKATDTHCPHCIVPSHYSLGLLFNDVARTCLGVMLTRARESLIKRRLCRSPWLLCNLTRGEDSHGSLIVSATLRNNDRGDRKCYGMQYRWRGNNICRRKYEEEIWVCFCLLKFPKIIINKTRMSL